MLKIKRTGGQVFVLPIAVSLPAPRSISNGAPVRDAAGNITSDMQWCRIQLAYTINMNRKERDAFYQLWKDSNPILTTSGATTQFTFTDDDIMTPGWVSCCLNATELNFGKRLPGKQETYQVTFVIECSASDFNTYRRTLQ